MKSLFNKYLWLQLILSILLLFGGTIIIVFVATNHTNVLRDGLNIITAVILFLFGLFAILASFVFETRRPFTNGLLYGSASIALGVFLCTRELILLNYLVYLLAIFFIVLGAVELIKGIIFIAQKKKDVLMIVITFVLAAILIAGGVLAIIFRDRVSEVFCIIAGVLLFAAGVYELVMGVKAMIGQSRNRPASNERRPAARKSHKREEKEEKETAVVVVNEEENNDNNNDNEIKELDYTKE